MPNPTPSSNEIASSCGGSHYRLIDITNGTLTIREESEEWFSSAEAEASIVLEDYSPIVAELNRGNGPIVQFK
jgi:hypothetical protein